MKTRRMVMAAVAVALLAGACGKKGREVEPEGIETTVSGYVAVGDSTFYGLACDGQTDSTIVVITQEGSDPMTYNVLRALRAGRVFGHPEVGDWVAVVFSKEHEGEAETVIDLDQLKGTWIYEVMPTLRRRADMTDEEYEQALAAVKTDSAFCRLMVPAEYGFALKRHNSAQSVGGYVRRRALDEDSPVEYPPRKRYTEWHIHNGRLVLTEGVFGRLGQQGDSTARVKNDTADFVRLTPDTLVLRFGDGEQGYRRKAQD